MSRLEEETAAAAAGDTVRDAAITATMLALLETRAATSTICPSDVARALLPDDEAGWRALMTPIRRVAATLADAGRVRVTRRGDVVDATSPGGPIRIGRPR